jgi:hypothetical protein
LLCKQFEIKNLKYFGSGGVSNRMYGNHTV